MLKSIKIVKTCVYKISQTIAIHLCIILLLGNKASLRSPTNKAEEDVTESVQMCVCLSGVI